MPLQGIWGLYGGFPKLWVPFRGGGGVLIVWGVYWVPLILGNCHIELRGVGFRGLGFSASGV